MEYSHLLTLTAALAEHAKRSPMTIAKWAGVHQRLFSRLEKGGGCTVATFKKTLVWFSDNWPADLAWPADIPRPAKSKEAA